MTALGLLLDLRSRGCRVRLAGDRLAVSPVPQDLRPAIVAHADLLKRWLRFEAEVAAGPWPPTAADESAPDAATPRQVARLRELARFPEAPAGAAQLVEPAITAGLTRRAAYHLIGGLGGAIDRAREEGAGAACEVAA